MVPLHVRLDIYSDVLVPLVAAETPGEVVRWLREHDALDAVVFMVPVDPVTATSVA